MASATTLTHEEERMFVGQPKGFPIGEFNIEDVMLPEDDDMGIASDDGEDDEEEIVTETGFGSVIVVDHLPEVPPEKNARLTQVLKTIFGRIGTVREGGFFMPVDAETNNTKGFAFVEYTSPAEAQAARAQLHGYKLDKNHTFAVTMFDDFDKYSKVPDEYSPPEAKPYQPGENVYEWLVDKRARDQFVIRHRDETEVFWNDGQRGQAEEVYKRSFWTESFVQWSPRGTMLTTLHRQGVAVWGGPSFARIQRYSHPGVQLIEFSPCEKYLITYSSHEPSNPRERATVVLNIADVRSGRKLRTFQGSTDEFAVGANAGPHGALNWPVFKWAGGADDKYFARLGRNMISIYECPDMGLLDKKSLKLDAVQDFAWSPCDSILCAYQSEQANGNLPARVSLIRIPDRKELRQKNLFSVSDIKIYWHPQGDYLAVKVDRFTKTKKSTYTSFELFSVKERDIPMEVLELPNKGEKVLEFAWEPKGSRFCILHGDGPRPSVSFYAMRDMKSSAKGVQLLGSYTNKQATELSWSPAGHNIILAGLKGMNGQLEFFNVDEMETMANQEHFSCTDVQWDPTGRYVATCVTSIHQMDNGYNIWSFNGNLLYRNPYEAFYQLTWRPRPPSLLPQEQQDDIVKRLKEYSKRYDEEDAELLESADKELMDSRKRLREEWAAWLGSKRDWVAEQEAFKRVILGDKYNEGEFTVTEVELEETIAVTEEPYRG